MKQYSRIRRFARELALICLLGALGFAALASLPANACEVTITNSVSIKPGAKWNPRFWFGNLDDPMPPPDYLPNDRHRVQKWYGRNNAHNFTFYVIGIADKNFRRSGHCPDQVFNPRGGWNWAICKYKYARLPFVSYQKRKFSFYLGWRERGDFGAKLSI